MQGSGPYAALRQNDYPGVAFQAPAQAADPQTCVGLPVATHNLHVGPIANGARWSTPIYDIFAQPGGARLCCHTYLLSCWDFGLNAERLEDPVQAAANNTFWWHCCGLVGLYMCTGMVTGLVGLPGLSFAFPLHAPLRMHVRSKLRNKYGIQGSMCMDCLSVWLCPVCSICQEAREITIRQRSV